MQDIQQFTWDADKVNAELRKIIGKASQEVHAVSQEKKVSLRTAAFIKAIERVALAEESRGG